MADQEQKPQEFVIRIPPRTSQRNYHIMKFRNTAQNDPSKWSQVRMIRENNKKEYKGNEEELPKFGGKFTTAICCCVGKSMYTKLQLQVALNMVAKNAKKLDAKSMATSAKNTIRTCSHG